jgi:hypothetical protein
MQLMCLSALLEVQHCDLLTYQCCRINDFVDARLAAALQRRGIALPCRKKKTGFADDTAVLFNNQQHCG